MLGILSVDNGIGKWEERASGINGCCYVETDNGNAVHKAEGAGIIADE